MATLVYIIRHCEKPAEGEDLSPEGRVHAHHIGKFFASKEFGQPVPQLVLCCMPSTLLSVDKVHGTANRAYQTAKAIGQELKIDVHTAHDLIPGAEAALADSIHSVRQGTILVAWEHSSVPALCHELGFPQVKTWSGKNPLLDVKPDDKEFSTCYKLDLKAKTFSFFALPHA